MSVTTRTRRRRKPSAGRQRSPAPPPAPTGGPCSLRAYARHRGVSHQAVMRAIAQGRLSRSVLGRQIVDVAMADREWAANTDLSHAPDSVKAQAAAGSPATPTGAGATVSQALAQASAAEKIFRAKLAEQRYRERAGELVEAAAAKAAWIDHITIARTKLLGIPSKFKQRRPHQTLEDLADLEALLREALEALALIRTDVA